MKRHRYNTDALYKQMRKTSNKIGNLYVLILHVRHRVRFWDQNYFFYGRVQRMNGLTAWGKKLICGLVLQQQMLLYLLSDGNLSGFVKRYVGPCHCTCWLVIVKTEHYHGLFISLALAQEKSCDRATRTRRGQRCSYRFCEIKNWKFLSAALKNENTL